MIQPKIQEVYIPTLVTEDNIPKEEVFTKGKWDGFGNVKKRTYADGYSTYNKNSGGLVGGTTHFLKPQQLITFTPEEFETFKREFGKELLEKAADNVKIIDVYSYIKGYEKSIDKESITSVLDDYLLNNKI